MSDRHLYQAGAVAALVSLASMLIFMIGLELPGTARLLLFALFALSFLVFLSALTSVMRSAVGIQPWIPTAAFGGGLAAVTINVIQTAVVTVAAREGLAPDVHDMLHQLDGALFFASLFPLSILLLGAGIAALRHNVLPRWFGWVSLVVGALTVVGAVLGLTQDNGIVFTLYLLWLLLVSVGLMLEARSAPRAASSPPVARPQQSR